MANVRKIRDAKELDRQIIEFIEFVEENEEIPSDYMLEKFLNISPSTLDRFRAGEGIYKGYEVPLKRLQEYREHRLLRQLEDEPKKATGAIFQLKQAKNGGYSDSPISNESGATVTLKIEGVGGVEAFR